MRGKEEEAAFGAVYHSVNQGTVNLRADTLRSREFPPSCLLLPIAAKSYFFNCLPASKQQAFVCIPGLNNYNYKSMCINKLSL